MRRRAPGMDDSFGNPLVVEVSDLLAQVVILKQDRSAGAGLERMIGVDQPCPLRASQPVTLLSLVRLTVLAGHPCRRRRPRTALIGFGRRRRMRGRGFFGCGLSWGRISRYARAIVCHFAVSFFSCVSEVPFLRVGPHRREHKPPCAQIVACR